MSSLASNSLAVPYLCKLAEESEPSPRVLPRYYPIANNPVRDSREDQDVQSYQRLLARVGLASLGLGLGAGAVKGLSGFLSRSDPDSGPPPYAPPSVAVEVPVAAPRKKRRSLLSYLSKSGGATDMYDRVGDWTADRIRSVFGDILFNPPKLDINLGGGSGMWQFANRYPMATAAIPAVSVGGLVGGYQLAHWLTKKRKKQEHAQGVEEAQRDYEQALLGQYANPTRKVAHTAGVPGDLLYASWLEKRALLGANLTNLYMLYAALAGGTAGAFAFTRDRGERKKVIDAALRRRAGLRAAESPPEMYLSPVEKPVATYDPEEEEPRRKKSRPYPDDN